MIVAEVEAAAAVQLPLVVVVVYNTDCIDCSIEHNKLTRLQHLGQCQQEGLVVVVAAAAEEKKAWDWA